MNELILSKEIYLRNTVNMATDAFAEISKIAIDETDDSMICSFQMLADIPVSLTICEFENYLIDLTVSRGYYVCN